MAYAKTSLKKPINLKKSRYSGNIFLSEGFRSDTKPGVTVYIVYARHESGVGEYSLGSVYYDPKAGYYNVTKHTTYQNINGAIMAILRRTKHEHLLDSKVLALR